MQTTNLPKRKPTRLKDFDYSLPRGYFVTICTEGRREFLSTIVGEGLARSNQGVLVLQESSALKESCFSAPSTTM